MGFGDPILSLGHVFWLENWGILPSIRGALPLGKTEENPYLRALQGQAHQHIQMGSGSFVPSFDITFFYDNIGWGILNTISQSLPFYENTYNYQPGATTDWSLGYWNKATPHLTFMGQIRGMHAQPERWLGVSYGGTDQIALNVGSLIRFSPTLELGIQLEKNLFIKNRTNAEEEPLNPLITWSLTLTR